MPRSFSWQITCASIATLVLFPFIALFWLSSDANQDVWSHLLQTVFGSYVGNSLILMGGVAAITLLLGVGSAWLVTQYRFFGVSFFSWALLLPLAMPTYISAYSYTGLLEVAGPVQSFLRTLFGWEYGDYRFPEIRSLGGAILVMGVVLYPYVYLLARASFLSQSQHLRDVGQLLGLTRRQAFFKITLPVARPAIIAGVSLALMETLADYGAVSYFGVNTFTTGIFRTWYGLDSIGSAAQLSLVLLTFVLVLIVIEQTSRRRARYHSKLSRLAAPRNTLSGAKQWLAFTLSGIPLLLGFIVPISQLLVWTIQTHQQIFAREYWNLIGNTLLLAGSTAGIALILALLVAYGHRIANSPITTTSKYIVGLGYAIPGTVIAVGTLIPLAGFDNAIDAWFRHHLDVSTGLLVSGSIAALVIAYLVRFMAVALNSVDAGLQEVGQNMDQAARSLGLNPFKVLRNVHVPILRSSLLTALLIVFVDVMKELPATLIMRPFNFNTLAVRAYELAADERLADAALTSTTIVLVGLLPIVLLTRTISR